MGQHAGLALTIQLNVVELAPKVAQNLESYYLTSYTFAEVDPTGQRTPVSTAAGDNLTTIGALASSLQLRIVSSHCSFLVAEESAALLAVQNLHLDHVSVVVKGTSSSGRLGNAVGSNVKSPKGGKGFFSVPVRKTRKSSKMRASGSI
jgi:hypothetical protein